MRRCWQREEVQESQGPRVPRFRGPKVPGSQGPGYLKLTFKYELDSKEGPSCSTSMLLFYDNAAIFNIGLVIPRLPPRVTKFGSRFITE